MKTIALQFITFLCVGFVATLLDGAVYYTMLTLESSMSGAKAVSYVASASLAFFLNKFFTFASPQAISREAWRFALVYGSTLTMNVLINGFVFQQTDSYILAFIIALMCSGSCNFLGQKFIVFAAR